MLIRKKHGMNTRILVIDDEPNICKQFFREERI
jgi:hypothetical protein